MRILIVLPVHNGARFLGAQLDSILAQEGCDFRILCRDDGSSDDSVALLAGYAASYPQQIRVLQGPAGNLGARAAFSWLLAEALAQEADYVAPADQDDLWHPRKLQRLLAEMQQLERSAGIEPATVPALVHSDLRVITANGEEIASSLARFQGLDPERQRFAARLLGNAVTGCSMLVNSALLERALPIPADAVMHDWWLTLVAAAFGRVGYIDEALLDYRQHDSNTVGARAQIGFSVAEIGERIRGTNDAQFYHEVLEQASAFGERYGAQLTGAQRAVLAAVRLLRIDQPLWQRSVYHVLRRL